MKDKPPRSGRVKVTRSKLHFTYDINSGEDIMYTSDNIFKLIEFLIDNIFVQLGRCLFHQVIRIPTTTNCAPLLADFDLYS